MDLVYGKKASELEAIFAELRKANNETGAARMERNTHYVAVHCDEELQMIPANAKSIGLVALPEQGNPDELHESVVFSLLLAAGSLNHCTLDVLPEIDISPDAVLREAESHGINVRVLFPENPEDKQGLEKYCELLEAYTEKWFAMNGSTFAVAPLNGYLEYKYMCAAGFEPDQITTDPEMQQLFTDTISDESMDYIKGRLDVVIERCFGGEDAFRAELEKIGAAVQLKQAELREARWRMLEQELDTRTPVPNLIRAVSAMTGLAVPDAAGMIYEMKLGIHQVLDKYLPRTESESPEEPASIQIGFAEKIVEALSAAFGDREKLVAAWNDLAQETQLTKVIDLDRGVEAPSAAAERASAVIGTDPKVAALAAGEAAAMIGTVLKAGKAIDEIGLDRAAKVEPGSSSNIIAVG